MKIKNWILSKLNVLLGSVLALLGFSNCSSVDDPFNPVCLYGTPYTMYDEKGAVLNTEGEKLEGMNVTVKEVRTPTDASEYEYSHVLDETTTGKDGKYASTHRWSSYGELKMRVVVEDPNGVYAADSAEVALTCTDEGRGDWCAGTDKGTADFKLKKQ